MKCEYLTYVFLLIAKLQSFSERKKRLCEKDGIQDEIFVVFDLTDKKIILLLHNVRMNSIKVINAASFSYMILQRRI